MYAIQHPPVIGDRQSRQQRRADRRARRAYNRQLKNEGLTFFQRRRLIRNQRKQDRLQRRAGRVERRADRRLGRIDNRLQRLDQRVETPQETAILRQHEQGQGQGLPPEYDLTPRPALPVRYPAGQGYAPRPGRRYAGPRRNVGPDDYDVPWNDADPNDGDYIDPTDDDGYIDIEDENPYYDDVLVDVDGGTGPTINGMGGIISGEGWAMSRAARVELGREFIGQLVRIAGEPALPGPTRWAPCGPWARPTPAPAWSRAAAQVCPTPPSGASWPWSRAWWPPSPSASPSGGARDRGLLAAIDTMRERGRERREQARIQRGYQTQQAVQHRQVYGPEQGVLNDSGQWGPSVSTGDVIIRAAQGKRAALADLGNGFYLVRPVASHEPAADVQAKMGTAASLASKALSVASVISGCACGCGRCE